MQVNKIVERAAANAFSRGVVGRVEASPTADSEGNDALDVLIVLNTPEADSIRGEQTVEAIFCIQQDLLNAGERRFPIVEFATEEELSGSADTES